MQAVSLHEAPKVNAIPIAQTVTDETLSVTIVTADGGCKHTGREATIQEEAVCHVPGRQIREAGMVQTERHLPLRSTGKADL